MLKTEILIVTSQKTIHDPNRETGNENWEWMSRGISSFQTGTNAPHINEEYIKLFARKRVWADYVTIQAMGRMLIQDIWIVTNQKTMTEIYL